MSEPLVIIGNGMAAARLVDELSKRALGRYAIAVIGEEPRLAYNRVLLSSVLAGDADMAEIELRPASWWRDRGVTLLYGAKAHAIDLATRRVSLESGESVGFSKLVLATGSRALRLPLPGAQLQGVHVFRDGADVDALKRLAAQRKKIIVIGGGLLGLEAAYGLVKSGAEVSLAHVTDRLMERQLDKDAAELLKRIIESKGIDVLLEARTTRILGDDRVSAIELADGRRLAADGVVFAAGIAPNMELARDAGVSTQRGIVIDDHMETNIADIFAIGECAQHRGVCYGLVEPAYDQARVLAARLCGESDIYEGSIVSTNLKVSGVNVFSAGEFMESDGAETISWRDFGLGLYKKLIIEDGRLAGAVLVGDTSAALWCIELIRSRADVTQWRDALIFGRALCERKAA
ncbi:NAD(P)/FAD-dependent oxidoreductase [Methylosinus sporium]|uniref:NAD(P)/FAD-dependent oxidoreductase n=1 Tax=Methylosinus sporium TaxID=428 RepID=A0A549SSB3_METSR|nr:MULTISPECIES: FAD-dependent oxidoreductase [Methylosinus]MBU3889649.1 FAD-dependent oxidoreductase [Methylosinus sp. KRF6]TRL32506.1 NAD(P)/FAD-dependent oxidoreductase [Methylosinus sporium]